MLLEVREKGNVGAAVDGMAGAVDGLEEGPEVFDGVLVAEDAEHEIVGGLGGLEAILGGGVVEEGQGLLGLFVELLEDIEDGFLGWVRSGEWEIGVLGDGGGEGVGSGGGAKEGVEEGTEAGGRGKHCSCARSY